MFPVFTERPKYVNILCLICLIFVFSEIAFGIDTRDTRMLEQPAISDNHTAFIYAGNLWISHRDGSNPRRLTTGDRTDSNPAFSPDGSLLAFSSNYNGNTDVYTVPVEGGIPRRLTWHPSSDIVRGFTPDGKGILFTTLRTMHNTRYQQLYTVSIGGGYPEKLIIPHAYHASYSPDGAFMAYTPRPDPFHQWKNYRGGAASEIWIFSFDEHSVKVVPKPDGGSNDTYPLWIDDRIYFISDRDGEFNLFSYELHTGEISKHTDFDDFPIISLYNDKDTIIFEQAGYLHTYNTGSEKTEKLTIGIAADLSELRPRFVKGNGQMRSAHISPTGARAVFGCRGEIITVPAEKGDPRNITQTPDVNERYPAWSPDGKHIAYFADESGENMLAIRQQDGKGREKNFELKGSGFYAYPEWSPDSRMISYADNSKSLYIIDITKGEIKKVSSDAMYGIGAFRKIAGSWSSDSKWLAYTKVLNTHFSQVFIYCVESDKSYAVTDGLSNATEPVFDTDGSYLFFFASTDAGPKVNWFDLSNIKIRSNKNIYLATLQKDLQSPFIRKSDEEIPKGMNKEEDSPPAHKDPLKIDLEGIENRIVSVPVSPGNYYNLDITKDGQLLYIDGGADYSSPRTLRSYDIKTQKENELGSIDSFMLSADKAKILFARGSQWLISDAGQNIQSSAKSLRIDDIRIRVEPSLEWYQIFDEAWRINRDYFYDPGMHGADWHAMKEKYEVFLPHLSCRNDLTRLISWMCSELAVGHHYTGSGQGEQKSDGMGIGLLGADYTIENGRYRFDRIYGGLNWSTEFRSPLTEPGINVKEGDYLLAVNGNDVRSNSNIYSYFENTAGKIIELTVGPDPDYRDSRIIKVVPVHEEYSLRNRAWVEDNLKRVTEATNGQVAYVYVPNTSYLGLEYFTRYFFPQTDRKAVIIDERHNGGGMLADYIIDVLMRQYYAHWNFRYGEDLKTPSASIQGPKIMIINESAVSGGDLLPYMFKKCNIGTLVGKRTFGALVGILGFPELMDGGFVTAPNLAIWTNEGFIVENAGIEPDIEVEQWPADIIKGRDPQLERAIEIALAQLEENPPEEHIRPPYPIRARQ